MASLVDQIFMQAQAGSAQGHGFADFYVQGKKLGLQQQQIDLQKQQLAAELQQLPLNLTLKAQDAKMKAYQIEDFLEQRNRDLASAEQLKTLRPKYEAAIRGSDRPFEELRLLNMEAIFDNPYIAQYPPFKQMGAELTRIAEETQSLMRLNEQARGHDLYERSLGLTERNVKLREEKVPLAEGDKMRLESLQKQLDQLNKNRLALPPEQQSQRFRVAMEAGIVQKQINEILAKYNQAPVSNEAPADVAPAQAPSPIDIGRFRVTPLP